MELLLTAQALAKSYGADPLFRNLFLTISEGDRLGLIGPNGSGKSTLLEILCSRREPDSGEVAVRKGTRLSYVAQSSIFQESLTIRDVIRHALDRAGIRDLDRGARESETLGRAGFEDFDAPAATLSGGWRKRLAIAEALAQQPDLLLLDEPTNHLDIAGIEWLETLLKNAAFACVVVSHDRYFLENVANGMLELSRAYAEGLLRFSGNYSVFLEKKAEYLHAQSKRQDSLENRVRRELEWLRRGPKARATKAKARIDKAHELIGELADLNSRSRTATADIDFTFSDRKTKRLIELAGVSVAMGGRALFKGLDLTITAGMRLGLVGPNGSGKTTLLRLLRGEASPDAGEIRRAEALRIVHFDQDRRVDPNVTLRRALAPEGDSVIFQDRVIHVNSWASRFLFASDQLNQPVGRLSGGEQARVFIANLMLQPADVLLLDEPTNDLDIPTLEVLEETLLEFSGALVLVTHDRYMLDRISTVVVGLDGQGGAEHFADYSQCDVWLSERKQPKPKRVSTTANVTPATPKTKKHSYLDAREYATIEQRISEAEQLLQTRREALQDVTIMSDGRRVQQALSDIDEAEKAVDALYEQWAALEEKLS